MLPVLTIILVILTIVSFFIACESGDGGIAVFCLLFLIGAVGFGVKSSQTISTSNTLTPGTIVKTPNAVIAEIRVGDRIERATFTDITTYQHATPETRIIWRVTETSWGKSGVIVLDLP